MRSPQRLVMLSAVLVVAIAVMVASSGGPDRELPEGSKPPQSPTSRAPEASSPSAVTPIEAAWTLSSRRLVSAPVEAGGKVVVYTATNGRLSLTVVDPGTGRVVARRPSSSSYVTPGVTMEVAARGDLVYHYRPTGRPQLARLEVYDARRDRVVARSAPAYFWSLPTGCRRPDGGPVCVSAGDSNPASVYRVSPRNGRLRLSVPHAGRSLDAGLYDASDRIAYVRADRTLWQRTAPALFGGRTVSPAEGWDWRRQGPYLIGSFGADERPRTGAWIKRPGHTARIDPRTGRTLWVRPGTAYCELDSMEPAADGSRRWFRCATTGRAPASGHGSYDLSHWRTTITRFDPKTGEALWTTPPARWDTIYDGSTWVKLSDSLVAGRRGGDLVTLDVTSGQVTKADPDAIGWCAEQRIYRDRESAARPKTRIARGLAAPCRADGGPVSDPAFVDPAFGVRIADTFVWASTSGLRAVRVG
jgi:hypothetical protein